MIFKKLTLKNFKSHINTEVEFNKGTTIILGDNGAGKSSIFEGINFALYKKYNTKSLNDLINTQANSMTVTLSFIVGNQEYKVKRTRNQKKSTAELFVLKDNDYHNVVSGDKEVNNHIEELLKIDADLFLNAIYIRQGEIDSLVTQKASDRKKNISKLLRLDNLETAYKDVANVISTYEVKRLQINNSTNDNISDDKESLIEEKKALEKDFQDNKKKLSLLEEKIKDIKSKVDEENVRSVQFHKLHSEQQRLIGEIDLLSEDVEDIEKQIANIQKYQDFIDENQGLDTQIEQYTELVELLTSRKQIVDSCYTNSINLEEALTNIFFLNKIGEVYQINDIVSLDSYDLEKWNQLQDIVKKDYEQTKQAKEQTDKQITDLLSKISVINASIANYQTMIESLESIRGVCPTCQSEIDDNRKQILIDNYNVLIVEDSEKLEKRNKELGVLQDEQNQLNEMLSDKSDFISQIDKSFVSKDVIDKLQDEVSVDKIEIAKIDGRSQVLAKALGFGNNYLEHGYDINSNYNDLLSKQKDYQQAELVIQNQKDIRDKYDTLQKQYLKKTNSLDEVNQKIIDIDFDSDSLQKHQAEQSQLYNQYYPLVKTVSQLENDVKYKESQIKTIDEKIKQNQLNKEQVNKLDSFIKFLKDIREIYSKDGLQKDIRLAFRPQIEKYTQDFFSKFDFDYSGLTLSEDYDINIVGPSGESDISMASGGEKIAIALSLRLGIASAITANVIETILLDEPTTYLDGFRKQEFVNVIQSISLVPQMIIITHDAELENAATNVITVEKKNGQSIIV